MSGKKYSKAKEAVERRDYTLEEAVELLQKAKFAQFDETAEIAMNLGVNPRHADQMVRGTVVLPNGLGKEIRIPIRRAEHADELVAFPDVRASQLQISRRGPAHVDDRVLESEDLLHCSRNEAQVALEPLVLSGLPNELVDEPGERVPRRLEAPHDQRDEHLAELGIGESIHIGDLDYEGIDFSAPPSQTVVMIHAPRIIAEDEEEEEGVEEIAAEGEGESEEE